MPKMHVLQQRFSLQKRLLMTTLLISMISSLIGLMVIVGVAAYNTHELFDDILEENAKLLANGQNSSNAKMIHHLDEYNEELALDFQIMANDQIIHASPNAPKVAFVKNAKPEQFYNTVYDGQLWRVYSMHKAQSPIQIQLAQPWSQRYAHLLPAIGHYIWVMLLLWLILAVGNWWAIRHSLKPLAILQQQIIEKNVQDLSAIQPNIVLTELEPTVNAINALMHRLELALQAEQRFTADAAHELRTPLAAIQMKLQLLQRRHAEHLAPIKADLDQLTQDVKRSSAVVENLLLLARLDPQQHSHLPKTNFVLKPFLEELWRSIQPFVVAKNIQAELDWQISEDHTLYAHRELCFTALRNLLDNAIRYNHEHGRLYFQVIEIEKKLIFQIQDNGIGVTPDQAPYLTQRFYRVLGHAQQGSGLGLSIVQHIIKLHDADLKFSEGLDRQGLGVQMIFRQNQA